jgi:hypothetical protein
MISVVFDGLFKYCGPSWLFGILIFVLALAR